MPNLYSIFASAKQDYMIRFVQFCTLIIFVVIFYSIVTEVVAQTALRNGPDESAPEKTTIIQTIEQVQRDQTGFVFGINPNLHFIPAIKSIISFTGSCRAHRSLNERLHDIASLDLHSFCCPDPVSYYIFGLRKIIT
jgi:hypothetical protein